MIIEDYFCYCLLDCIQKCPKLIQIKTEVLYVRKEINNHKTMEDVLKTNFNQNLRPKSMCMCVKYNIVWGKVFPVFTVF